MTWTLFYLVAVFINYTYIVIFKKNICTVLPLKHCRAIIVVFIVTVVVPILVLFNHN